MTTPARGRRSSPSTRQLWSQADIVLKVQPPEHASGARRARSRSAAARRHAHQLPVAGQEQGARRAAGGREGHRDRHRSGAAHHARAEDGRAVVDGQHRRLSRGDRSRQLLRPFLHRTDDRGRTRAAGEGAGHRRRRRRAGGHRRGARAGRDRPRLRHARRRPRSGQEHGRRVPRGDHRTRKAKAAAATPRR